VIPEDVIAEIRSRVDIVAVIGEHVQLRKAGRNFKGLCPFHGEKTPSFNVAPDKGFFYCFGCQKKGDVFTFVMEYSGRSFTEAAEQLAARVGVVLPKLEESPELRRARSERVAMLELNRVAADFFREVLAHPGRGAAGRAYLEKRGVDTAICDRFLLGAGPPDWHALADHLKAKRADLELAVKLGLIARQPRSGGFYDRYRDRLVCPVVVPGGEIVGFSARLLEQAAATAATGDEHQAPKYINSPESTVYKKGKLLFGLAQAREAISAQRKALVVEGNFDVITLHQAGFVGTLAPLGTALTPDQLETLRRFTDEIIVCYDGDRAGRTATRAALEVALAADIPARVVEIPMGEDPDSLVRKQGPEALRTLVDRAQGGVEYFCFEVWGRARDSAEGRSRAIEDASRVLSKVANPTKRDLIAATLATAMGVDQGVIRRAMNRSHDRQGAAPQPVKPSPDPALAVLPPMDEVELVALIFDHPALATTSDADKAFSLLTDARLRDICSAAQAGKHSALVAPSLLPAQTAQIVLSGKYASETEPRARLSAMLVHLQRKHKDVGLAQLKIQLVEAQRKGDRDLARKLANEIVTTRKQVD
jgi:DNA primase